MLFISEGMKHLFGNIVVDAIKQMIKIWQQHVSKIVQYG